MAPQRRVLIVDDEEHVRAAVSMQLGLAGYEVLEASNAKTGIEMVESHAPDVILLDLNMPDGDGWDFLDELQHKGAPAKTPVVVLTADCDEAVEQRARAVGARAFVAKPVPVDDMERVIRDVLSPASDND